MKGVLKIRVLKKILPTFLMAFGFLFINLNAVNAEDYIDEIMYEDNISQSHKETYNVKFDEPIKINRIEVYNKSNTNLLTYELKYKNEIIQNFEHKTTGEFIIDFDKILIDEINIPAIERFGSYDLDLLLKLRYVTTPDIKEINFDININEITFNYELPADDNFSHLELHQDGSLLADNITTNDFTVTNLEYDTKYNFTFYAVDKNGNKSAGISREISIPENPALIPSNNIFSLNQSVSDTTVSFNYNLPSDPNFSHLKIYRNNELITDNYQLTEYTDINLTPETEYNYRFVSVNKMDISNAGYSITIKTMEENDETPPAVPTGLNAKAMNSGIVLSWNSNNETDLKGYNIYLNGTKLNNKPISNTIYNVTNLENGTEYNFTISAVDTFDNESEQSSVVSSIPDVDELPIFKLDTSLSSVASSIENWFSQIWVIVAFATSIPLAFLIAQRVKYLFIA